MKILLIALFLFLGIRNEIQNYYDSNLIIRFQITSDFEYKPINTFVDVSVLRSESDTSGPGAYRFPMVLFFDRQFHFQKMNLSIDKPYHLHKRLLQYVRNDTLHLLIDALFLIQPDSINLSIPKNTSPIFKWKKKFNAVFQNDTAVVKIFWKLDELIYYPYTNDDK